MPSLKSSNPTSRVPDWLLSKPVAHRGLHNSSQGIAENSLSSFASAVDHGFSIELDLRFSADEIPIVFHDENLIRMTGTDTLVAQKSANDLGAIQLLESSDFIPTLSETLDLVCGKVPLVLEVKPTKLSRDRTIDILLTTLSNYQGEYCIQSFDPFILKSLLKKAPDIVRGQLGMKNPPKTVSTFRKAMLRYMPFNPITKPDYIGYDIRDIEYLTSKGRKKPKQALLAWTVKSDTDLEKARRYADNVIFENLPPGFFKTL